jgi:hypothetical protein
MRRRLLLTSIPSIVLAGATAAPGLGRPVHGTNSPKPVIGGSRSHVLGWYAFPNPGVREVPSFPEEFDQFTKEMGVAPLFQNTFVDQSSPTQQDSSQYWWANPMKVEPRTMPGKIVPVAGVVSSNSWNGTVREGQLRDIVSGKHDSHYRGAVQAWRDAGYPEICLRIDWEMNGTFMPWNWIDNRKQSLLDAGKASFRHISQLVKTVSGITVHVEWNPCSQKWCWTNDENLYPGDDVVDVIALDLYSFVGWNRDFRNWNADGTPTGSSSPDLKTWAANPNNRRHFWDYPGSFGLLDQLARAAAHNKPWSLCECGTGWNPTAPDAGITDDGEFPTYLAERFDGAKTPCRHINVWTLNTGDGNWDFLRGAKPKAAAAWRKSFGEG